MGGGASSATKQQQQLTLQQTQSTMQFDQHLMDLFDKQFANQQVTLDFIKSVMQPIVKQSAEGKGFSDPELAALRTTATDTISGNFANAQAALDEKLKSSGSSDVPSGVTVGADTALLNAEAQAKAGAQNTVTLANAQQARSNLFNAANVLQGVAAQNSPNALESGVFEGGSNVAALGNSQSALQNAITQANANSFFGKFGGAFASALGNSLGGGNIQLTHGF